MTSWLMVQVLMPFDVPLTEPAR